MALDKPDKVRKDKLSRGRQSGIDIWTQLFHARRFGAAADVDFVVDEPREHLFTCSHKQIDCASKRAKETGRGGRDASVIATSSGTFKCQGNEMNRVHRLRS